MNGVIEIKVGGQKFPLKFGMMAMEELTKRQFESPSTNSIKILTDLVYAGLANASYVKGEPIKGYEEVSDLVDELLGQEDKQAEEIWNCFNESKAGKKLQENLKKKQEERQNP